MLNADPLNGGALNYAVPSARRGTGSLELRAEATGVGVRLRFGNGGLEVVVDAAGTAVRVRTSKASREVVAGAVASASCVRWCAGGRECVVGALGSAASVQLGAGAAVVVVGASGFPSALAGRGEAMLLLGANAGSGAIRYGQSTATPPVVALEVQGGAVARRTSPGSRELEANTHGNASVNHRIFGLGAAELTAEVSLSATGPVIRYGSGTRELVLDARSAPNSIFRGTGTANLTVGMTGNGTMRHPGHGDAAMVSGMTGFAFSRRGAVAAAALAANGAGTAGSRRHGVAAAEVAANAAAGAVRRSFSSGQRVMEVAAIGLAGIFVGGAGQATVAVSATGDGRTNATAVAPSKRRAVVPASTRVARVPVQNRLMRVGG